jgi:hypothetical protein
MKKKKGTKGMLSEKEGANQDRDKDKDKDKDKKKRKKKSRADDGQIQSMAG